MSKHTPGPWIIHRDDVAASGEQLFAVFHDSQAICAGAMEGDARLIAAAPDLLAALKEMCTLARQSPQDERAFKAARAAIAKAEVV